MVKKVMYIQNKNKKHFKKISAWAFIRKTKGEHVLPEFSVVTVHFFLFKLLSSADTIVYYI